MVNNEYSVIIGVYDGIENINLILESLYNQTHKPKEIFIWVNKNQNKNFDKNDLNYPVDNIIISEKNGGCYYRFVAGYLTESKYLLVLDDDIVPGKKFVEKCMNFLIENPNTMIGSRGIKLNSNIYGDCTPIGAYDTTSINGRHDLTEVDLIGHAFFIEKKHLKYLLDVDKPYIWSNGEDIQLGALSSFDNVRKYVIDQDISKPEGIGSTMKHLGCTKTRLSSSDPHKHIKDRNDVVSYWIGKGWKPLFMRQK